MMDLSDVNSLVIITNVHIPEQVLETENNKIQIKGIFWPFCGGVL